MCWKMTESKLKLKYKTIKNVKIVDKNQAENKINRYYLFKYQTSSQVKFTHLNTTKLIFQIINVKNKKQLKDRKFKLANLHYF